MSHSVNPITIQQISSKAVFHKRAEDVSYTTETASHDFYDLLFSEVDESKEYGKDMMEILKYLKEATPEEASEDVEAIPVENYMIQIFKTGFFSITQFQGDDENIGDQSLFRFLATFNDKIQKRHQKIQEKKKEAMFQTISAFTPQLQALLRESEDSSRMDELITLLTQNIDLIKRLLGESS